MVNPAPLPTWVPKKKGAVTPPATTLTPEAVSTLYCVFPVAVNVPVAALTDVPNRPPVVVIEEADTRLPLAPVAVKATLVRPCAAVHVCAVPRLNVGFG